MANGCPSSSPSGQDPDLAPRERVQVALALERLGGALEPGGRQPGRLLAVRRRDADVQRLHRRAEIRAQPRRQAGGDGEGVGGSTGVEAEQPGAGGGGADRAEGRGGVEAERVVAEPHRLAEPDQHLGADRERVEQILARGPVAARGRQQRRQDRRARVAHRQRADVVVVEHVAGHADQQRRVVAAIAAAVPERRDRRRAVVLLERRHQRTHARLGATGQRHRQRVQDDRDGGAANVGADRGADREPGQPFGRRRDGRGGGALLKWPTCLPPMRE